MISASRQSASFAALVEPHLLRLYRFAFRLTGNAADAEDLVQDVLIKAHRHNAELAHMEHVGPWLRRVLYNRFIDHVRRDTRRGPQPLSIDDPANAAAVRVALHGDTDRNVVRPGEEALDAGGLQAALAKLSFEHRTVVLMHDCEGYTLEEIEATTGVALGTVKSRLHRARARLRELLAAEGTV